MNVLKAPLQVAVGLLMVIMTVVVSMQVLSRFVLNASLGWTVEIARMSFVYLVLIGMPLAMLLGQQLVVEVVTDALKGRKHHALRLITSLLSIGFWAVVVYSSGPLLAQLHEMTTPVVQLPGSVPYAAVTIGGVLIIAILARDAVKHARNLINGAPVERIDDVPPEVPL